MENINWKEKADELVEFEIDDDILHHYNTGKEQIVNCAIKFTKFACEEQKKICAENAKIECGIIPTTKAEELGWENCTEDGGGEIKHYFIDKPSISNSPTVNFD